MKIERGKAPKRTTELPGETLADDLIGNDPIPADARRFDEQGERLPSRTSPLRARARRDAPVGKR